MGRTVEVKVPDIGDFKDVEVIEVLAKAGDAVAREQSLITVESDKASMEIPSSHAGVVRAMRVKLGDKVSEGSVILELEAAESAAAANPPQPPFAKGGSEAPRATVSSPPFEKGGAGGISGGAGGISPTPPTQHPTTGALQVAVPDIGDFKDVEVMSTAYAVDMVARPTAAEAGQPAGAKPHASPSVRKFARELGVDLTQVAGSGPKGRITQDDVREHVKRALAGGARPAAAPAAGGLNVIPWPQVDFAKFGPIERVEMSRIKKLSGPNLARNWVMIPHVTNHEDADITELEAFRVQLNKENEKSGVKVTMLAFLIKACVAALKKFPDFNSSIAAEGDAIIRKNYWHIGFAADTPNGLVVPVIKDADKKGIFEIAQETAALAAKARDGKLAIGDMQGGTFSISSLGGIGGTYFTPIINAPEVAILGVCRSTMKPVWDGKQFVPRLVLPLSLSWDHRVVDGASAARFNAYLASLLADFRRVLL
jgi:pyruvate dehydrogenase E2 component (dihydrolipoamide acetyltransferase)